jgi:hypothetical protein
MRPKIFSAQNQADAKNTLVIPNRRGAAVRACPELAEGNLLLVDAIGS